MSTDAHFNPGLMPDKLGEFPKAPAKNPEAPRVCPGFLDAPRRLGSLETASSPTEPSRPNGQLA